MPSQDTSQLKQKIISLIRFKGPSLPVHVAKEIGTSMLFASAFLSELISEKRIKTSNLRVGSSPLYFIPGQEHLLERFSQHLRSKEKEAFELLSEKKVLKDSKQHPAIRVALTEIKDFAIPFQKDDELYWKYFTVSEQELMQKIREFPPEPIIEIKEPEKILEKPLVQEKEIKKQIKKKVTKKKGIKKKASQKKNDKFFNRVKEFLAKKSIGILDIEGFSKNDLRLKVKVNKEEKLLVAYNKKRVTEEDIVKAHKRA